MSSPSLVPSTYKPHCWHLTDIEEYTADYIQQEEICCRCGGRRLYRVAQKAGREGHGPHVPGYDHHGLGSRDTQEVYSEGVDSHQCNGVASPIAPAPALEQAPLAREPIVE